MLEVQVRVKWKLLFTCIQQSTTCCLNLHCFDDPTEAGMSGYLQGLITQSPAIYLCQQMCCDFSYLLVEYN